MPSLQGRAEKAATDSWRCGHGIRGDPPLSMRKPALRGAWRAALMDILSDFRICSGTHL